MLLVEACVEGRIIDARALADAFTIQDPRTSDSDRARDRANAGGGFKEVCDCLASVAGVPARSWKALETGTAGWYLGSTADAVSDE